MRYEPFSPVVRDDPYPYYAELRREAPLYWAEEGKAWCLSRHDDVQAALRSAELFSSDAMRSMLMGSRPGIDPMQDPETMRAVMALAARMPFELHELGGSRNLISEDPPRHGLLRSVVNRGFTPRRIAAWEPRVREIVAERIAGLRDGAEFDLVEELAIPVPVRIIAEMIGVEPERFAEFKRWSDVFIAGFTGSLRGLDPEQTGVADAMGNLLAYVKSIAEKRRRDPGDDLISVLIAAQGGEAGLSDVDVVMFIQLLLVAGNETTTNLIGNTVHALLRHPEQLARLESGEVSVPMLIEETLRWDASVQYVFRRSTTDVHIGGGTIPANSYVVVLIGSANRDERQWGETADKFDVGRNPQGHLAFGFGNHFCLGAALARLEARVALEALVKELPRCESLEPAIEYVDSFLVRGPKRLRLRRR